MKYNVNQLKQAMKYLPLYPEHKDQVIIAPYENRLDVINIKYDPDFDIQNQTVQCLTFVAVQYNRQSDSWLEWEIDGDQFSNED